MYLYITCKRKLYKVRGEEMKKKEILGEKCGVLVIYDETY